MAKHVWSEEEEKNIYNGFFNEKISLSEISKKYQIGLKPLRRYIQEHNWERENISLHKGNGSNAFKDETGNRYGRLTVVKALDEKDSDNRNLFLCQCDCGNIVKVSGKRLRGGITTSCGCKRKETAIEVLKQYTSTGKEIGKDLTGNRFGKLTVLKEVDPIQKRSGKLVRQWLCQCDCGNQVIVQHVYLTTGDTQSCGCINSQGAAQIEILLQENNIHYSKEYSFKDLRGELPYRFDFAIYDQNYDLQYLIEYDGMQHYDNSNGLYSLERVKIDYVKNQYCLSHNIPLIRIPYDCKDNINLSLIQLSTSKEEYIVREPNHYHLKELEDMDGR